jgi:hypothetical protein
MHAAFLLFTSIFVLLNAMFVWLPTPLTKALWHGTPGWLTPQVIRLYLAYIASALALPKRLLLAEPHAAP